jgi:hypothetical protein
MSTPRRTSRASTSTSGPPCARTCARSSLLSFSSPLSTAFSRICVHCEQLPGGEHALRQALSDRIIVAKSFEVSRFLCSFPYCLESNTCVSLCRFYSRRFVDDALSGFAGIAEAYSSRRGINARTGFLNSSM